MMTHRTSGGTPDLMVTAGEIVAAYVSNNHVAPADLPALIGTVHAALTALGSGASPAAAGSVAHPDTVAIRRSVGQDGIVSFINGRSYKTLKRHLATHGLTPERYRERYGLPADYPMVAAGYAARRSSIARQVGLGRVGGLAEPSEARKAA